MSADATKSRSLFTPGLVLAGLFLLALALRVWRVGDWTFDGDEIYTLRDSLQPRLGNPRPLLFLLNYYLVRPFLPLDEFGLRILPALAGALAVPALFVIGRALMGTRAGLFSALLVAVNPVHIYHSQYARYWAVVFLLSAIYPYALYLGVQRREGRWLGLGILAAILAVLAHPMAVLLVGGLGLCVLLNLRRDTLTRLWSQPSFRWFVLVLGILVLVATVRSVDMLQGWIAAHDVKTRVPDHLRDAPRALGVRQLAILLTLAEGLTLPVTLMGLVGIYLLRSARDRELWVLLTCLLFVPVATVLALSTRTPVSVTYLMPAVPVLFLGAGAFLDRLTDVDWGVRPRWLVPTVLTAALLAAGLPSLVSQYRDGRRYDFRGAARWLDRRLAPGDMVFSVQSRILSHYLERGKSQPLAADTVAIAAAAQSLHQAGAGRALWIVAPAPSHAFRSNLKRGGLIDWMFDHCQLRNSIGVGRMDFRQQYLHIYRCPPAVPGSVRVLSGPDRSTPPAR